jgi:hypothetical protein
MRRYKYLEKMHEEEMNKILVYLKGFSVEERKRLAQVETVAGNINDKMLTVL